MLWLHTRRPEDRAVSVEFSSIESLRLGSASIPSRVVAWAIPLLVLVLLVMPILALASRRAQAGSTDAEMPSTRALAAQTLVVQAILILLAWLALRAPGVSIAWRSEATLANACAGVGVLLAALAAAWLEARGPLGPGDALRRKLRVIGATDPWWLAVMVVAAMGEELAYRGVLTSFLADPVGLGLLPAALASALVFGLGHASQGWRGFAFSAGFGLAMQGLASLSGGLGLPMIVHLAYDLGAAAIGRRLAASGASGKPPDESRHSNR